ncbi:MAG: LapA family protein [Candidatus Omnitrophica bacterium]|nr:LapA family protein [Candidatus Omnitrophota bacterium]
MNWRWIVVLLLMSLLVIFATQNYEVVKVQFLIWSFETSRAIVIFVSLLVGFIIGTIVSIAKKSRE